MHKRILIVDDEKGLLLSYKAILEGPTVEVDTAESVDDAETLLRERDYHVAIVDIRISDRKGDDGFRLLRCLKEQRSRTDTIMVTGYGNPENMEKAYVLGAAFYFEKPISLTSLQNALQSLGVDCDAVRH